MKLGSFVHKIDLLRLVLRVLVTSASLPKRIGVKKVLKQVHHMGDRLNRLHTIWMDERYRGKDFMRWVMDMFRWIVEVVLRPMENKGFVLLPKRWVVERTFGCTYHGQAVRMIFTRFNF